MKQSEEYFLGEKGVVNLKEIQWGKLNIITAPCGSGKTTFVEKKLWSEAYWGDLLYLIDSRNALDAFKIRGEEKEYNGKIYYKHRGITAMTYATFAALCIYKSDEWLWNDENLRDYNSQNYTYITHDRLAEKWLDRRLYEEDKALLCEELNIRDERGRLFKWPNVKKSLRFSDFQVTDKQEKNGRRYSIIEW